MRTPNDLERRLRDAGASASGASAPAGWEATPEIRQRLLGELHRRRSRRTKRQLQWTASVAGLVVAAALVGALIPRAPVLRSAIPRGAASTCVLARVGSGKAACAGSIDQVTLPATLPAPLGQASTPAARGSGTATPASTPAAQGSGPLLVTVGARVTFVLPGGPGVRWSVPAAGGIPAPAAAAGPGTLVLLSPAERARDGSVRTTYVAEHAGVALVQARATVACPGRAGTGCRPGTRHWEAAVAIGDG